MLGEILTNIGFDWQTALFNLVNFLIVFYLLKRYAFAPTKKVLGDRRQVIEDGLEDARLAERDRVMAGEELRNAEKDGQKKRGEIIASAEVEGKQLIDNVTQKARAEAKKILVSAQADAEQAKSSMEHELKAESVDVVISATAKFLGAKMDKESDKQLIQSFIK